MLSTYFEIIKLNSYLIDDKFELKTFETHIDFVQFSSQTKKIIEKIFQSLKFIQKSTG